VHRWLPTTPQLAVQLTALSAPVFFDPCRATYLLLFEHLNDYMGQLHASCHLATLQTTGCTCSWAHRTLVQQVDVTITDRTTDGRL